MPLVPAKCTICGALLNIDSSKEAAVCQSCGNAFVVEKAINNYNTYNSVVNNITSDNVIVHIESEKERLNTSAETYIKLGDMLKALATYRELVDKFPDDWRGWWGSIYYQYGYGNIKGLYSAEGQAELKQKMAFFKKIAPLEEFEKLDEVITARIEEVRAAIENENLELMSDLNNLVDNSISVATQQIEEKTQQLLVTRGNYDRLNLELQQAISTRESIEADEKKMKNRSDTIEFIPYFGVIGAIIFGVLGLLDGAQFFMVLVVCIIIGAVAYGVLALVSAGLNAALIKYPEKELQEAKNNEVNVQKRVDAVYIALEKQEREVERWNKRKNYMQDNKEQIISALFKEKSRNLSDYVDKQLGIRVSQSD